LLRTDTGGAIEIRFAPGTTQIGQQRERARRYWHDS
jgi:beta-lactamase superfamily II metal-dependent hydrolase